MDDPKLFRAAKELLTSPAYEPIIDALREYSTKMFMGTNPADRDTREQAYFIHLAIEELDGEIRTWAKKADN